MVKPHMIPGDLFEINSHKREFSLAYSAKRDELDAEAMEKATETLAKISELVFSGPGFNDFVEMISLVGETVSKDIDQQTFLLLRSFSLGFVTAFDIMGEDTEDVTSVVNQDLIDEGADFEIDAFDESFNFVYEATENMVLLGDAFLKDNLALCVSAMLEKWFDQVHKYFIHGMISAYKIKKKSKLRVLHGRSELISNIVTSRGVICPPKVFYEKIPVPVEA